MPEKKVHSLNSVPRKKKPISSKKRRPTPKKRNTEKEVKLFSFLFAKKTTKNKSSKENKNKKGNNNVYKKITLFLVVLSISTFTFIASLSHIFTWETQDNVCGGLGYTLANVIVGKWFGIWGFLLPLLIILITTLIINKSLPKIRKFCASTLFALAIFPPISAFIFSFFDDTFCGGVGIGGGYGSAVNLMGREYIGSGGMTILSVTMILLWILYSIPKSDKFFIKSSKKISDKIFKEPKTKKENENNVSRETIEEIQPENSIEEIEKSPFIEDKEPPYIPDYDKSEIQPTLHEKLMAEINAEKEFDNIGNQIINDSDDDIPMIEVETENEKIAKEEENEVDFEIAVTGNSIVTDGEGLNIKYNVAEELSEKEIKQEVYDPTRELSHFKLPPVNLLNDHVARINVSAEEKSENKRRIVNTLKDFGINIDSIRVTAGPTVTLYEIVPAAGVRISKIKNLEDDIALSLSALGIRIIAPMPGKGTVGIEVPNKNKEIVSMYSVIKSKAFQESKAELPIVLGRTIQNQDFVFDLAKAPHLLVAGATGQGKSVGLNAIIASLLYKKHPAELKFVLVDPKKVELALYKNIENHYLAKLPDAEEAIITETDKVVNTLNSLCIEMDERYSLLKSAKVVRIKDYNEKFKNRRLNPNKGHRYLPYFVVIIDEFADLIMTAGKEIETPISRIAQLARAVGIHLVIATQRPTVNIITGVIKANFPTRIAFRVTSSVDSKTILDQVGANQLVGAGDMLISSGNEITRVQCAFIDTPEVEKITEYVGEQQGYPNPYELPEFVPETKDDNHNGGYGNGNIQRRDAKFEEIAHYVVQNQQGSASTIQRNFSIGFNRAGRIMDQLEKAGIVGSQHGSKARTVLVQDITSLEILLMDLDKQ